MEIRNVSCPKCGSQYKNEDIIFLDLLNTITHKVCFEYDVAIKDQGQFDEIIRKYSGDF